MRAREFIIESVVVEAKVGREYQHLEDLLIVNGSAGGIEAVQELIDSSKDPSTLDIKWDGGASVYWGRDNKGNFIFLPKNQWIKGQALTKDQLEYEIQNTGRPKANQSQEEFRQVRRSMSDKYSKLWDIFERATPVKFRGYLNGDLMFTEKQSANPETGEYEFTPNKVTYHVKPNGLGGKIKTAEAFVVVHGRVNQFGADATTDLRPENDGVINQFNGTPELIVLNTQKPAVKINAINKEGLEVLKFIKQNKKAIDGVVNYTAPKFTTLKKIMYDYSVARSKGESARDFAVWLKSSKLSDNQKAQVGEVMKMPAWQIFWAAFNQIQELKHDVLEKIQTSHGDSMYNTLGIRSSIGGKPGGEGMVRRTRTGGLVKLINPAFRSAPANPKFNPDS